MNADIKDSAGLFTATAKHYSYKIFIQQSQNAAIQCFMGFKIVV